MRAALYIRVSTEEQALHGLSVEAQTKALDDWAESQRAQVVGRYIDAGISARKKAGRRPELQRLLADVRAGKIDLVVFTKLDRWFRSVAEYYKVQEVLEAHGVNWKTIHEEYDSSTASGRLKINIMLSVGQDEADRDSERIKAVFDRKRQRGEPLNGNAPFGYAVADKKLVVDPAKAPIVQDLFRVYIANRSAYVAQRHLRNTYEINYDISTVKRLLKNRKYIGEAYGMEGFCEPIIDKGTFNHAQEILAERAQRASTCEAKGRVYIFKGLVACNTCGHIMTACVCKGNYYYRCTRRTYVGDCTFAPYVREDALEAYLLENILRKCAEYNIAASEEKSRKPQVDEAAIKRKMTKLKDLYLSDLIGRDEYERDYVSLRATLEEAQKMNPPTPVLFDLGEMQSAVATYMELDRPQRKEFWSRVLQRVYVNDDMTFSFTLRSIY